MQLLPCPRNTIPHVHSFWPDLRGSLSVVFHGQHVHACYAEQRYYAEVF